MFLFRMPVSYVSFPGERSILSFGCNLSCWVCSDVAHGYSNIARPANGLLMIGHRTRRNVVWKWALVCVLAGDDYGGFLDLDEAGTDAHL